MAQQAPQIQGRDVTALVIQWTKGVTELVLLKGITGAPQVISTSERWETADGTPVVSYVAHVDLFSRSGKKNTLRLRYEKDDQTDSRVTDPSNDARFGVSVITWDTSGLTASAEWTDADDKSWNGPAKKVTVLLGPSPVTEDRVKNTVSVIVRPKQSALRAALLMMDQSCVLTTEKEAVALEAAHIVPVKAGGRENVENAILLRVDLHRLFDADLFWFDLSEDKAVVRHSMELSDKYKEILTGTKLPYSTFQRVERALRFRAELRDGNGGARHRAG